MSKEAIEKQREALIAKAIEAGQLPEIVAAKSTEDLLAEFC